MALCADASGAAASRHNADIAAAAILFIHI
jgi:hypothetical protein